MKYKIVYDGNCCWKLYTKSFFFWDYVRCITANSRELAEERAIEYLKLSAIPIYGEIK